VKEDENTVHHPLLVQAVQQNIVERGNESEGKSLEEEMDVSYSEYGQ